MRNKFIIGFLCGFILSGIMCVFATYAYEASEIKYTTSINTNVKTVADAIDNIYSDLLTNKMDLLWTNPNPLNAYSGGTITLDLSNYDYIAIDGYQNNINSDLYGTFQKNFFDVDNTTNARFLCTIAGSFDNYNVTWRTIVITKTGITLGSIGIWTNGSSEHYAVPYHIWGIKHLSE